MEDRPVRKHEPCPESYMENQYPLNTICQLLRDTYHLTDDPQIRVNLRIAVSMAKSMVRQLKRYQESWDRKGFWEKNPQYNRHREMIPEPLRQMADEYFRNQSAGVHRGGHRQS